MRKLNLIRTLLLALCVPLALASTPSSASAQIAVGISVHVAPPAIPVYVQPACPTEGYLWTPGYWAYGDAGYYWVPGVWVAPPRAASSGLPDTGASSAAFTAGMPVTGDRTSVSTAA